MFPSRIISQVRRQIAGRGLNLRFLQHVAVTAPNFDNIEFTGNNVAPAELPVKISADRKQAPSDEHNPPHHMALAGIACPLDTCSEAGAKKLDEGTLW